MGVVRRAATAAAAAAAAAALSEIVLSKYVCKYVVVQFEVRNSKEKRIFTRFLSEENLCKTIRLSGGLYCPDISSESEILEIR